MTELGRRGEGVRAPGRPLVLELAQLLRQLLIFVGLLDDLFAVLRGLLVIGGVAQEGGQLRIVGHGLEAMIDPAVEGVPLLLRLEDRFTRIGEVALLVIF